MAPRVPTTSEYGVLDVRKAAGRTHSLDRFPPSPGLGPFVERHWLVSWELPAGRESSVSLLPHPCVNLVFDGSRLMVAGVGRDLFTYPIRGEGRVFGVKFRPGAFYPFLRRPVVSITGVTYPAEELFGPAARELAVAMSTVRRVEDLVALVERFLQERLPAPDPQVDLVGRIVAVLLHDRTIGRVDEIERRFGISARTLQRLFARYIGVSPKWVLRRYRLHEAAAALAREQYRPWAEVAAELGYFDQSHFIRDFTAAVGMSPAAYARVCRQGREPVSA